MRRDQAPKANVDLTRKAMSVENINKLKPVLMKNINLNQKVRKYHILTRNTGQIMHESCCKCLYVILILKTLAS